MIWKKIAQKAREWWKAIIAGLGTLMATVLASVSDKLTEVDWSRFDRDVVIRAIALGALTGIGVWAKANAAPIEAQNSDATAA